MKPLDFIKTKKGSFGIITEVSTSQDKYSASIEFIGPYNGEKSAWWTEEEFKAGIITVIDSLPDLLARNLSHPFGGGSLQPFKIRKEKP